MAARCGLRPGDIVVRLCGQSADRMTHLMAQQTIASCRDTLEIIVERFRSVPINVYFGLERVRNIVMRVYVCLSVCFSVCPLA